MYNRYYVMRHGESTANRKGLIVCREQEALNSYGLTSRGADQTLEAAVKTRLDENTIIVSSDFLRARETAQIVHKVIDTKDPVEYYQELRERSFGELNLCEDSNYEQVWRNDLKHPNISTKGVETVPQVLERAMSLLQQLESKYRNRTILLVGHGDVLQILISHFNGIECRFHRSLVSIKNAEIRVLPDQIDSHYLTA